MRIKKIVFYKNFNRNSCASILNLRVPICPTRCTSQARLILLVGRKIPALKYRHLTEKPNFAGKNEPIPAKTTSRLTRPKIFPFYSLCLKYQMPEPAASYGVLLKQYRTLTGP